MVSREVCIGPDLNNITKYTTIFNLLSEEISYGIDFLVVYLDSQVVVSQLNNIYRLHDPYLYHQFFRVRMLQQSFFVITYVHIPWSENSLANSIANQALVWHINHSSN